MTPVWFSQSRGGAVERWPNGDIERHLLTSVSNRGEIPRNNIIVNDRVVFWIEFLDGSEWSLDAGFYGGA